jgi:drug/metabolite transporter (DMT)-like permease
VRRRTAYLELVACGLVWGSIGVLVKRIDLPAPAIVFARLALGAAALAGWAALRGRPEALRPGPARGRIAVAGLLLALHWTAFFEAYKRLPVATTILVVYLGPVLIAAAAPRVLGEPLERRTLGALTCSLAGIALIAAPAAGGGDALGFAAAALAACSFAAVVLALKRLPPTLDPAAVVTWQLGVAAVVVSPAMAGVSGRELLRAAPALLLLGLVHTGLAGILYIRALQVVRAQHVSILVYLEPVTAILWAWAVLGERPGAATLAGGALVVAAGLAVAVPGLRPAPTGSGEEVGAAGVRAEAR